MKSFPSILRSHYRSFAAAAVCVALVVTLLFNHKARAQESSLAGFTIGEVRFDENLGAKPTPQLPRAWRFIGVSNGENTNSNNLWFQDKDGSIYLVQGFTSRNKFALEENIQKLNVSQ